MGPKCEEPTEIDKTEPETESKRSQGRRELSFGSYLISFFDVCLHELILKSYLTMTQF